MAGTINFFQISILLVQGFLIATLILFLFRLRLVMGLGLLFTALGLFQFMQVFLSSTIYVEISKTFIVSPGSSVLFSGSLFAILLIYIKEDAIETRKVIYALLIVNIVMSLLLESFKWNIGSNPIYNPFNVSTRLFDNNAWVLFVGTLALFIDSLLIIILYEFISKHLTSLFLRISMTMVVVLSFDTLFFSLISFWNLENLNIILYSGLLSKAIVAIFYSILFTIYLKYLDVDVYKTKTSTFNDVFHSLTYRQKFEMATREKEIVQKEAEQAVQLSESKYKTLTNISPVGIFLTRVDGYTIYTNPKWSIISGLQQEDALGWGWLKAVHPDDKEIIKTNWDEAVAKNEASYAEYRFIHKDGSISWVLGQAVPEYNKEIQIIGYVGTITDITAIKLYEFELNKAKLKAEESDRLKSAFLANMSHEIRTPMNSILGFAELLKKSHLSGEKQKEYIRIIEQSGIRMLNLINDIIDISKVESGQMEVYYTELNLDEIMEYIYSLFKPEADKKGIQIIQQVNPAEKGIFIKTDRGKIIGILTNLVKNSIKFTPKGTIEFGYQLKLINESCAIEFFVKDTGIGIPGERQQAVFDRFVQADIADTRALQGAGLGLSISKAYVEMLGGTIWVESKEGSGSTFYFTLPCQVVQR